MSATPIAPMSNLAALRHAEWRYNEDADEMNVQLPESEGRSGRPILVNDEFYVRLDVQTGQLLSIIIPAYTHWQAEQRSQAETAARSPSLQTHRGPKRRDAERRALVIAIQQAMRQSPELTVVTVSR